jgi:ADP-ribose pyrophosphatase YjhB (NUDIX family)
VLIRENKVLLVRRLKAPDAGAWSIPGGKVDFFEPLDQTVRREIEEEVGLIIEAMEPLCVVESIDRKSGYHWVSPIFLATRFSGVAAVREPDKHDQCAWFALDALPSPLSIFTVQSMAALGAR